MDYKKLYREAKQRAIDASIDGFLDAVAVEEIFQELKSEDERIREELIAYHRSMAAAMNGNRPCVHEAWIAWLEKQSKENMIEALRLEYEKGKADALQEQRKEWTAEDLLNRNEIADILQEYNRDDLIDWLERQGEQKPIDKIQLGKKYKCIASPRYSTFMIGEIYKPEDKFLCSLMNFCHDCFEPIEDGEQKPADKVEPKFKVGDWITDGEKVWKIGYIEDDRYIEHRGTISGGGAIESIDKHYHLWTIEDAKDGDVLACGDKVTDCPFIFHNLTKELNPRSYCGVNTSCCFQYNDENGGFWCDSDEVRPATKEQCDFLFSKMKEAGYKWDAEKKKLEMVLAALYDNVEDFEDELTNILFINTNSSELPVERLMGLCHTIYKDVLEAARKEIEKNPTLIPKFKVGDTIRLKNSLAEFTIESISNGRYYFKGSSIDIIACDHDYELAVPILANSAKTCKDEKEIRGNNGVISPKDLIEEQAKFHELFKDEAQLKQEWSEEDIDKLTTYLHEKDGGMLWRKAKETAIEICDILKPQPKQEWSKEDDIKLKDVIGIIEDAGYVASIREHYIIWLKSLKERMKKE